MKQVALQIISQSQLSFCPVGHVLPCHTHHSLVVVIPSQGLILSVCVDSSLLSDVAAPQPLKKSENGFHTPTRSGSLSSSKLHPACSELAIKGSQQEVYRCFLLTLKTHFTNIAWRTNPSSLDYFTLLYISEGELASEGVFLVLFSPLGIAGSGYIINTPVKDTPRLLMTCILRRWAEAQACKPEAS